MWLQDTTTTSVPCSWSKARLRTRQEDVSNAPHTTVLIRAQCLCIPHQYAVRVGTSQSKARIQHCACPCHSRRDCSRARLRACNGCGGTVTVSVISLRQHRLRALALRPWVTLCTWLRGCSTYLRRHASCRSWRCCMAVLHASQRARKRPVQRARPSGDKCLLCRLRRRPLRFSSYRACTRRGRSC